MAVAMSGGVDSSVAAALLIEQGYKVTGLTMKLWDGEDDPHSEFRHSCYGPGEYRELDKTRKLAKALNIPLHVIDLSKEFHREVLDYFSREYLSGRTPNPCVRCNRLLKFEALVNTAKNIGVDFDYFATGHYCGVAYNQGSERYLLKKGKDAAKDQSYFLAFLSQEQLSRTMFPVGMYTKDEVRQLAGKFGLTTAEKPESQDFIAAGYRSIITTARPGIIKNSRGETVGKHESITNFTIGQRKGLGISSPEPSYVTDIDAETGIVTVGGRDEIYTQECTASGLNWIAIKDIQTPIKCKVKIRSSHNEADATVIPYGNNVRIRFEEPQMAITPGQAAVFYEEDTVIGGGIIERNKP